MRIQSRIISLLHAENFTHDRRIGLSVRGDPVHGIVDGESFVAGPAQRSKSSAAGIN